MQGKQNYGWIAAGLTGSVAACLLTGGFFYEGGSDVYTQRLISGYFSGKPEPFLYTFGFHVFISEMIKMLYQLVPAFPWYDLWTILLVSIAFVLGLSWLLKQVPNDRVGLVFLYALFMFEYFRYPEITKHAFLLAFYSLLHLVASEKKLPLRWMIFYGSTFTLGLLTRAEAGFLAVLAALPVAWISGSRGWVTNGIITARTYIFLLPILFFLSFALNYPWTDADRYYLTIRPYQFTLWDFHQDSDAFCIRNRQDSVALMAASNHFLADTAMINKKRFDAMCVKPKDKRLRDWLNYLDKDKKEITRRLAGLFSSYLWVLLFPLGVSVVIYQREKVLVPFLSMLFAVGYFACVMTGLAIFMKTERHVMMPLLQGVIILCLFFWRKNSRNLFTVRTGFILWLLLAGVLLIRLSEKLQLRKDEWKQMNALFREINQLPEGSIVCFDLYTFVKTHPALFRDIFLKKSIVPYSFDNGFMFLAPSMRQQALHLFQSTDFGFLYATRFKAGDRPVFFVFSRDRYKIFESMASAFYHTELHFETIPSQLPSVSLEGNYQIYRVR